jgi:Flp pilus assembly protein TadB
MLPDDAPEEDAVWADSADRKIAIRALAEHRAEEHLSTVEHDRRRDLARQARTLGELRALFDDLPAPHPILGETATDGTWFTSAARAGGGAGLLLITGGIIVLAAILAGWWLPAVLFACVLVVATVWMALARR